MHFVHSHKLSFQIFCKHVKKHQPLFSPYNKNLKLKKKTNLSLDIYITNFIDSNWNETLLKYIEDIFYFHLIKSREPCIATIKNYRLIDKIRLRNIAQGQ